MTETPITTLPLRYRVAGKEPPDDEPARARFHSKAHIVSFKADLADVDVAGLDEEMHEEFKMEVAAKLGVDTDRIEFAVERGSQKFALRNRVAVVKVLTLC